MKRDGLRRLGATAYDKWCAIRRRPWANIAMLFGAFVLSSWWAVQHGPDQQLSASTRWVVFTTVFAAILGLFRDGLVRWIWFPELDMEFKNGRPYCDNPPETV